MLGRLNNIKWRKFGHYNESFLFDYMFFSNSWNFNKSGIDFSITNYLILDFDFFVDKEQDLILKNKLIKEIKHKNYLSNYLGVYHKKIKELLALSEEISKIRDLSKYSNKELIPLFKKWIEKNMELNPFLYSLNALDHYAFDDYFSKKMKKFFSENDIKEIMHTISVPSKEFYFVKDEKNLLRISSDIRRDKKLFDFFKNNSTYHIKKKLLALNKGIYTRLLNHKKKFSWLNSYLWLNRPYEIEYYILKIKKLIENDCVKELNEKEKNYSLKEEQINNIKNKFHNNQDLNNLIDMIREFIYLKTYRIDIYSISGYKLLNLLDEISRRLNISYGDLVYLSHIEIIDYLVSSNLDFNKIKNRKKNYSIIRINNSTNIYTEDKYLDLINESIEKRDLGHVNEIKGKPTYHGWVKGRARIIKDQTHFHKIKDDDIIVSPMTDVNFIVIMHKIKGIVTDEGGILCHSAIISREFKIPCIIGTSVATQVLHDNDLIELDAITGVVRKIN